MFSTNSDISTFKGEIFKYGLLIAVIIEAASLPFLGPDKHFAYGLAVGVCIAIVNFNIMVWMAMIMINSRKGGWVGFVSYMLRLLIYGIAFYVCIKTSHICGLAAVLGFLTLKLSTYFVYGIKPRFSKTDQRKKSYNDLDQDDWPRKKHWYDFLKNPDDREDEE